MASTRVIKTLYKSILKISKKFDNNPTAKSFIFRKYITTHHESSAELFFNKVIDSLLGPDKHIFQFHTGNNDSFMNLTRLLFRTKNLANLKQFEHAEIGDRIEVSYAIIRKFSTLWNYYLTMAKDVAPIKPLDDDDDKDSVLTSLPPVKLMTEIVPGTLLLAHPMTESALRRSVVLVLRHGATGSYGVILNRQSASRLRQVVIGFHASMKRNFGKHIVSYGGKLRRVNIVHKIDGCSGSLVPQCADSEQFFFDSNIEALIQKIEAEPVQLLAAKEEALVFVGCCAWDPNQLDSEFSAGYWLPVSTDAGNGRVLQLVSQRVRKLQIEVDAVAEEARKELQHIEDITALELELNQINSDDSKPIESAALKANDSEVVDAKIDPEDKESDDDDNDDDEDGEVEGFDKDYANDMWRGLLLSTGDPKLAGLAGLPSWIDASKIASIDWK